MRDVFDGAILVVVPAVHFLVDVPLILLEFAQGVGLDLLDFVSLSLQLCVQLLHKFTLLLETLLLLSDDRFLDLRAVFSQIFKDFAFFLDTGILLCLQIDKVLVHLGIDGGELVIKTLNPVASLLCKQVLQVGHPIVAALVLTCLVLVLLIKLVIELSVQVVQLPIVLQLVCLERIVDFLSLVHSVLLDVFDLPKEQKRRQKRYNKLHDCEISRATKLDMGTYW